MNAKKFEKKLNQYYEQGFVYPGFIRWAYSHDKKSLFHDQSLVSLLQEHYKEIVSKCSPKFWFLLVSELARKDDMNSFTKKQIPFLLSFVDSEYSFFNFDNLCPDLKIKDYINRHFTSLISKIPNVCFYSMAVRDGDVDDKNREALNQFLTKNKREYVEFLLGSKLPKDAKNYDDVIDVTVKLVDEILEHENLSYGDIRQLNSGGYSNVALIGSKVLKLGKKRDSYYVPNNEYLLKPYIRVDLEDISDVSGTIEVVEKVDTNVSDVDLDSFYKELRKKGIVWLDIKSINLGILLQDNTFHWNKQLSEDMSTRGILGDSNYSPLPKGSPVILDSDHIYSERLFDLLSKNREANFKNLSGYYFEERYQKELADMLNDKDSLDHVSDNKNTKK